MTNAKRFRRWSRNDHRKGRVGRKEGGSTARGKDLTRVAIEMQGAIEAGIAARACGSASDGARLDEEIRRLGGRLVELAEWMMLLWVGGRMQSWGFRSDHDRDDLLQCLRMATVEKVSDYRHECEYSTFLTNAAWMNASQQWRVRRPIVRVPAYLTYDSEDESKQPKHCMEAAERAMGIASIDRWGRDHDSGSDHPVDRSPRPDEIASDRERLARRRAEIEEIRSTLPALSKKEAKVIECRYLGADTEYLQDIGRKMKLTRSRIQQIERDAIRKIKVMLGAKS